VSDCRVCGDRAIAHMHYGGICCYSCKAFFRRAVQSGKDKVYRCKRKGECQVSVVSRRGCQRCRFSKCLAVGMTTSWVLSEEQCTIRFGRNPGKCGRKRHSSGGDEVQGGAQPRQASSAFTEEDAKTVDFMRCVYEASKEMINFSENNNLLWDKIFGKEGKHDFSAKEMSSLVSTVIKKNIFFIEANSFFKSLPASDQRTLLSKNMTEMCHLRGALRFDLTNKSFQWYFNTRDQSVMREEEPRPRGEPREPRQATITEGDIRNFYNSEEAARNILGMTEKIAKTQLPPEVILMMMHVVVFSGDGVVLERGEVASTAQVYYLSLIHRYLQSKLPLEGTARNISQVMAVLVELRESGEKAASAKIGSRNLAAGP